MSATTFEHVGSLSPRDAAAEALARLLLDRLEARVFGGLAPDRSVRLSAVHPQWPDGEVRLETPCASLTDVHLQADDWEPIDLEEEECAVRAQEHGGELAVDLWATDCEERRALKAAFLAVFRLGRTRAGMSVIVRSPEEALPPRVRRFASHVRLTLSEPPRDLDDRQGAQQDLWRAQARVEWEAELVTIEQASRIEAVVFDVAVTAP